MYYVGQKLTQVNTTNAFDGKQLMSVNVFKFTHHHTSIMDSCDCQFHY